MIVIGLTGKAGAGKDTVADRLVERHGFQKMAFAGPLKDILRSIDPIIGMDPMHPGTPIHLSTALERMTEAQVKALFPLYRKYCQKLGTEGVRKYDPEFWIKASMREVEKLDRDARVVFTDCRFPNEAAIFHKQLGWDNTAELWEVRRADELREAGEIAPHASEQHVGNMGEDMVVHNNGTLDDLHWIVDELTRDLIEVEAVKLAA